jgi:hypothetical protein
VIASLRKKNNFTAVYTGLIKLGALSFSFTILKSFGWFGYQFG